MRSGSAAALIVVVVRTQLSVIIGLTYGFLFSKQGVRALAPFHQNRMPDLRALHLNQQRHF